MVPRGGHLTYNGNPRVRILIFAAVRRIAAQQSVPLS